MLGCVHKNERDDQEQSKAHRRNRHGAAIAPNDAATQANSTIAGDFTIINEARQHCYHCTL